MRPAPLSPATHREERRRAPARLARMPVLAHIAGNPKPSRTLHAHRQRHRRHDHVCPEGLAQGNQVHPRKSKDAAEVEVTSSAATIKSEGSLLPVEFLSPAPLFWKIVFPPNSN